MSSQAGQCSPDGGTDEHLPVIDGIRVLEGVDNGSDIREVQGENAVLVGILDGLSGVGFLVLGGRVRGRCIRTAGRVDTFCDFWENLLDMMDEEGRDGERDDRARVL